MAQAKIKESELTKGQARKLEALRKSIGAELADEAFSKWLAQQAVSGGDNHFVDTNAELIEGALAPLLDKLRIPRGQAYAIRRGRGRFIVQPIDLEG